MKIATDKEFKGLFKRINNIIILNGSNPSHSWDNNNNKDNNNEDDDGSWYCIYCQKTHFEPNQCRQYIFGDKDEWCNLCEVVHNYDKEQCPKGGKWKYSPYWYCSLCNKEHYYDKEQCPLGGKYSSG